MNRQDELITRWIDGELDAATQAEFDALLASDPQLAERAKANARAVGDALRKELPASLEPPYPEFFNSQIQKHIHDQEAGISPSGAGRRPRVSVLSWLMSPFTIGAAAAVLAVLLFTRTADPAGDSVPRVVSTYAPDPMVKVVRAEYDEDAEATVILLTGLARIPDDVEVNGKDIATYQPAGPRGFGRFYTEDAELAYIMETDADGAPNIFAQGVKS